MRWTWKRREREKERSVTLAIVIFTVLSLITYVLYKKTVLSH